MQLHRRIDDFHAKGVEIFAIGSGSPSFIEGFRETTGFTGPIYTDPSLAAYKAAHLERGMLRTFDPRGLGATIRAFRNGSRQGKNQGDAFQQGGVVVVTPGGDIAWRQAARHSGDNAAADAILAALP